MNYIGRLSKMNACTAAVEWCAAYPTLQRAWDACPDGQWMLWLLGDTARRDSARGRKTVLAGGRCARLGLNYLPPAETRPRKAIETGERWARRDRGVGIRDVRLAIAAAQDAEIHLESTGGARSAGSWAAYAAYAAVSAAIHGSQHQKIHYVAGAIYTAVLIAAGLAFCGDPDVIAPLRGFTLRKCADIVREFFPRAPRLAS